MELTYTVPSTRVYPDQTKIPVHSLFDTFSIFNRLKEYACNQLYDERILQLGKGNITKKLKELYFEMTGGILSDYYCTSIYSTASGMISSIKELYKIRKMEHDAAQNNRKEKLTSLENRLKDMRSIKEQLVNASRKKKLGRSASVTVSGYYARFFPGSGSNSALPDLYAFECMIDQKIRLTKKAISNIKDKINRIESSFPKVPARPTFGGKKDYRKKDTLHLIGNEMSEWRKHRDFKRNCRVSFSGRHTSKYGNFQCMYDPDKGIMRVKLIDGKEAVFTGVWFPYRGDFLAKNLKASSESRRSVGYTMEFKKDRKGHYYILFKATITEGFDHVNFSRSSGVIAVDLNTDNISWCDLDEHGNYLSGGVYYFDLSGRSSGERRSILGNICARIIRRCSVMKKPLVIEDLDLKKKLATMEYGNRKANRAVSGFAYRMMTELLVAGATRNFVGIHQVNPAFTSVAGKTKYMRRYGITVHEAAAYCIGRKALGFKESSPAPFHLQISKNKIKDHTHMWRLISNTVKGLYPRYFQNRLTRFKTKKELTQQLKIPYKGKHKLAV